MLVTAAHSPSSQRRDAFIAADESALIEICGISLLERLLRNLQRLGIDRAVVLSCSGDRLATHLARPSWARSALEVSVHAHDGPLSAHGLQTRTTGALLLIDASTYYDPRLLRALLHTESAALLIDSDPPSTWETLLPKAKRHLRGAMIPAAYLSSEWLASQPNAMPIWDALAQDETLTLIDAAKQPTYVTGMRRSIRPLWFPAPDRAQIPLAEKLLLDTAQNGTLDFPAKVHAPIETWIIARLCRTSVTPNQITLFTAAVSALGTILFFTGHLFAGTILALAVGVLDGLDGKQARVKVETTALGQREHALDYLLELSWWSALAWHFTHTRQVAGAFGFLVLLVLSDLVDRLAKKTAKDKTGRNLDDLTSFDRFVRLIGGRRNIYIWMLAAGLLAGIPDQAFRALCWWGALTAAIHLGRSWQIGRDRGRAE